MIPLSTSGWIQIRDKVDKVVNHPSKKVTEEEKALRKKIKW